MKKLSNNQRGFHLVGVVILALVIGVVAATGFYVVGRNHKSTQTTTLKTSVPTAPTIKTAKDLDAASKTIDQLDTKGNLNEINNIQNELKSL